MNTQQIQRGLFGYRGLIAILRLPMLLASMTLARRLRAGLHGSRATRFPNTLLIVLTLFGASSAAGADWAANYGAVSPVGALASTSATAVDASGNIYLAALLSG